MQPAERAAHATPSCCHGLVALAGRRRALPGLLLLHQGGRRGRSDELGCGRDPRTPSQVLAAASDTDLNRGTLPAAQSENSVEAARQSPLRARVRPAQHHEVHRHGVQAQQGRRPARQLQLQHPP